MSPSLIDGRDPVASQQRRRYRRAIIISILFHGGLLTALLFWYVPTSNRSRDREPTPTAAASTEREQEQSAAERLAAGDKVPPVAPNPDIPSEQIRASIESQLRQTDSLSDERKLAELEKNLQRLESLSSEESVREVTAAISGSLGLQPGPVPLADTPAGVFDVDTAQIHDVTRRRNASGAWEFQSVLVDAQGRTREVTMPTVEGEAAYNAFEQMKRFPMAADIYRQLVMPMIQNMMEAGKVAEKAATEAEMMQQDTANSP